MADRRRIVTIAADGTVTTVKDLEDGSAFFSVRDSFTVKAGARKTVMAQRQRRYGGAFAAGESHENGSIGWKALVKGASADAVNTNVEAMLGVLETGRLDYFFEWRPDGATASVYYEVRGPASWTPQYQWATYAGTQAMYVDVEIPVGPLPRGAVTTQSLSTHPINGTFEATANGWAYDSNSTGTSTFARAAWSGLSGAYALRVKLTSSQASKYVAGYYSLLAVTAGQSYTVSASADVQSAPTSSNVYVQLQWLDSGASVLSASDSATATGTGVKALSLTATAPAGAVNMRVVLRQATGNGGTCEVYWDSVTVSGTSDLVFPVVETSLASIAGSAPALCDVQVAPSGGSSAPIWALVGWCQRPSAPQSGSVAPFGIVDAETGTVESAFATGPTSNASSYRWSEGLVYNSASGTSAAAYWVVDPGTMQPDDFTRSTVDVEVWARVRLPSTIVSPNVVLSLDNNAGSSYSSPQYSQEYGSSGKLLAVPSSGNGFRLVKLGTLTMPTSGGFKYRVKLAASWSGSSSGELGVDYLVLVPARQRACSKSAVAADSSFPKFVKSTSLTTKTVRSDLSGVIDGSGPDSGLNGAPIELPPGNVDMVFVLSSVVADEPASSGSMQLEHPVASASLKITPRYWLVK